MSGSSEADETDSDDERMMAALLKQRYAAAAEVTPQPQEEAPGSSISSVPEVLRVPLDDVDDAVAKFRESGVVVCEDTLPEALLESCCCAFRANQQILFEQLSIRGVTSDTEQYAFNEA